MAIKWVVFILIIAFCILFEITVDGLISGKIKARVKKNGRKVVDDNIHNDILCSSKNGKQGV